MDCLELSSARPTHPNDYENDRLSHQTISPPESHSMLNTYCEIQSYPERITYFWLCAVINQLPYKLLALLQRPPDDDLRMRRKIQRLPSIWRGLDQSMICRRFRFELMGKGIPVDDR